MYILTCVSKEYPWPFWERRVGRLALWGIKIYEKTMVIKTSMPLTQRQSDWWNEIESPETDLYIWGTLIYDRRGHGKYSGTRKTTQ